MTYLSMTRGDDRVLEVTATESLDGSDVTFTARHRRYSEDAVILKTSPADITIAGPLASVTLAAADTADLDPDVLYWDIEVVDSGGSTHTVADGRLAIQGDVSRA